MTAAALVLLCGALAAMLSASLGRERTLARRVIDAQRAHLLADQDLRDLETARAEIERDLAAVTAERDELAAQGRPTPRYPLTPCDPPLVATGAIDATAAPGCQPDPALRSEGG